MQTAEIAIALIVAMSAIEQRHLTCAMRCWNRLSPVLPPPAEGCVSRGTLIVQATGLSHRRGQLAKYRHYTHRRRTVRGSTCE
jgi:hypothetical protein